MGQEELKSDRFKSDILTSDNLKSDIFKVLWIVLLLAAVIVLFSGCGTPVVSDAVSAKGLSAESSEVQNVQRGETPPVCGVSIASDQSAYQVRLYQIMQKQAEEKGIRLIWKYADWDASLQNRQIRELIDDKVDVLIICPVNSKSMLDSLKEARSREIPVVNLNMKVDAYSAVYIDTYVGASSQEEGSLAAQLTTDLLPDGGKVAILEGTPGTDPQIYRTQAFVDELGDRPDIQIADIRSADWNRQEADSSAKASSDTKEASESTSVSATSAVEAAAEVKKAETGDTPTIAFVPKVMGQAWWDYVQKGVEEWSKDTGYDVIYKGPTEIDAAAQVQIMTDLVNQGVDILCFSPNDPDACEAICKQARDKGIIVISTEASGMENIDYDVEAFDEAGMGGFLMDQLASSMGEKGQYITMVGSMTMESQNNWADAAVARQEEAYPDMELVADKRVADDSDAEKAYELTKQLLQKYPDLKGILGTGSFDAPGAARAI